MHLGFGLGKAYEDLKQYDQSLKMYITANSLERRTNNYSIEREKGYFDRIKKTFNQSFVQSLKEHGCKDEAPVFVLGMPRSGTSLVEQILDCHSEIYGAGELDLFFNLAMNSDYGKPGLSEAIKRPEEIAEEIRELGEEYCSSLRELSDNRFVIDKLPHNFLHIGLIKLALPNAKIIHCKRKPEDNCLSLFKTYFSANIGFSYDLTELGKYHLLYQDLMEHWHATFPGQIFDVNYEEMINDQEKTTKGILEYCGLEWDVACLEFHKSNRPVKTASVAQVRKPIYKSSVDKWKRYENQLDPLLTALRPAV